MSQPGTPGRPLGKTRMVPSRVISQFTISVRLWQVSLAGKVLARSYRLGITLDSNSQQFFDTSSVRRI